MAPESPAKFLAVSTELWIFVSLDNLRKHKVSVLSRYDWVQVSIILQRQCFLFTQSITKFPTHNRLGASSTEHCCWGKISEDMKWVTNESLEDHCFASSRCVRKIRGVLISGNQDYSTPRRAQRPTQWAKPRGPCYQAGKPRHKRLLLAPISERSSHH